MGLKAGSPAPRPVQLLFHPRRQGGLAQHILGRKLQNGLGPGQKQVPTVASPWPRSSQYSVTPHSAPCPGRLNSASVTMGERLTTRWVFLPHQPVSHLGGPVLPGFTASCASSAGAAPETAPEAAPGAAWLPSKNAFQPAARKSPHRQAHQQQGKQPPQQIERQLGGPRCFVATPPRCAARCRAAPGGLGAAPAFRRAVGCRPPAAGSARSGAAFLGGPARLADGAGGPFAPPARPHLPAGAGRRAAL